MLSTHTLQKFPTITIDELARVMKEFEEKHPKPIKEVKCSPEAYIAMRDYFIDEEMERIQREAESRRFVPLNYTPPPVTSWGSLFGIEIILDPDMKPGEWKFV